MAGRLVELRLFSLTWWQPVSLPIKENQARICVHIDQPPHTHPAWGTNEARDIDNEITIDGYWVCEGRYFIGILIAKANRKCKIVVSVCQHCEHKLDRIKCIKTCILVFSGTLLVNQLLTSWSWAMVSLSPFEAKICVCDSVSCISISISNWWGCIDETQRAQAQCYMIFL